MFEFLNLSDSAMALTALAVVALMFVLFLRESFPTEVTAIAGAAVLLATGILTYEEARAALAST